VMSPPANRAGPGGAELGLLLPSRETLLWADADPGLLIASARSAEQAGYDSVWVGDSLLSRPRFEPLTLLAAVAAVTRRVRLGTAVLLPLLRHPLSLAHALASLDRLAGGRLVIGAGPGPDVPGTHAELAALGAASDRRVSAVMDSLQRCRRLWCGEEPGIELLPAPAGPAGPPLWLAGNGPRMLRLTGSHFDGWLPFSPTPARYATGLRAVREAADQAGRDPGAVTAGAYLTVAVAGSPGQAAKELDTYMNAYYGVPGELMAQVQACHAGTLESAADWLATYAEAGARHIVIRLACPALAEYDDTARELLRAARRQGRAALAISR
jgi:alkanesulfonate monooxygenase SsuD/methylene tetrahydromethanopterin reductase-like flavin-dependent oxidoreductase (luciferase family)